MFCLRRSLGNFLFFVGGIEELKKRGRASLADIEMECRADGHTFPILNVVLAFWWCIGSAATVALPDLHLASLHPCTLKTNGLLVLEHAGGNA